MKIKIIFLAAVALTSLCVCQLAENNTVPDELKGVWKTSVPKYKDRSFELTEKLIIFVSGDLFENIDVNLISKIEIIGEGNCRLYAIQYENMEKQDFKLSFYYEPSDDGVIRFKNQQKIEWRKEKSPEY